MIGVATCFIRVPVVQGLPKAALFYFLPRPALAYCRIPFCKSTRQPWRPTRLGGSNISATLHRSLATSRSATGRTHSLYGWTIDSAPASCAPSSEARRTARLRPRRTRQKVAASAPNLPPPFAEPPAAGNRSARIGIMSPVPGLAARRPLHVGPQEQPCAEQRAPPRGGAIAAAPRDRSSK